MTAKRPSFNDDVLREILLRVSAKSLGRFKAASRLCYDVISDPRFQADQARRSLQKPRGLFTVSALAARGAPLYFSLTGDAGESFHLCSSNPRLAKISIKAACNGLVVFEVWEGGIEPQAFMVGNPTTKTYRQIPRYSNCKEKNVFGLAFDTTVSTSVYKIVNCTQSVSQCYVFTVFSPETGAWKTANTTMSCGGKDNPISKSMGSVLFNGALHWIRKGGKIIAFDVNQERAYAMATPEGVGFGFFEYYSTDWFGVAMGCMTLVQFINGEVHVWKLADYGRSEWRFDHRIRMQKRAPRSKFHKMLVPVFFDGESMVFMVWEGNASKMTSGVSVCRIGSRNRHALVKLESWRDSCRIFFPYISHMISV